jgi:predicted ATP-dependent endonuclease of OLD family
MKLVSFEVDRFRNILASGSVPVDESVTCLVGKNESGKTNLLHALRALNPAPIVWKFDEQQYPRWLQKVDRRSGEFEKALPINATFELTTSELDEFETVFGVGTLPDGRWTLGMDYKNTRYYAVNVDEGRMCMALAARHGISLIETKLDSLRIALDGLATETETGADKTSVATDRAQRAIAARDESDVLFPESVAKGAYMYLAARMPRMFYFDSYSVLQGRTEIAPLIEALRTNTEGSLSESQRTALSLLQLGYASESLINSDYESRSSEMEDVAAELTRNIQKYWHQNTYLRLKIDIESEEFQQGSSTQVRRLLQLRVEDTRHFFTNNLDVRSSGFRWFVSFLAAFSQFSDEPVVLLLDEPALELHARAQKDFLEFIESAIGESHQVIYTTHSPFMVDPAHLERVRVVEDLGPEEGAVVRTQLMSRDPDTLSPLQVALGYDIAQNIFVGPDNLVVEGLSDYTYLTVMSETLRSLGRSSLSERWRILPAGGAGSMPAAVALMGEELDVTVVVNSGSRPPAKLQNLVDEGLLDATRIVVLGNVIAKSNADIEDVFELDDYLALYNGAMSSAVAASDLGAGTDGVIARINRTVGEFNHNDPSNWLLANRNSATASLSAVTLNQFEALIIAINLTLRT